MPFIQPFLPRIKQEKNILFLCVDHQKIHSKTVDLARLQLKKFQNILWIDANLGISDSDKIYSPLEKVMQDKAALPKAIRHSKHLSILSGKSTLPLFNCSEIRQKQFFIDLETLSENYDQVIVSSETIDSNLQNLWLNWAQKKFLLFTTKNIYLEKTAEFLKKHADQLNGLICLDKNKHQANLAWLRLQKMLPNLPPLITEIEKTAQEI